MNHTNSDLGHIDARAQGDQRFVLRPDTDDLFVRTGRQIIDACGLQIGLEVWLAELTEMLEQVRKWAGDHHDQVVACIAAPTGPRLTVFVVPTSGRYDFDLADDMARLNIDLVQQFNIGMVDLLQIPSSDLERFVNPAVAKWVYGEPATAHQSMDA